MARREERNSTSAPKNPYLAVLFAWLIPGGGHLYLGRRARAFGFLVLVLTCIWIGCTLEGKLYTWSNVQPLRPLSILALLDSLSMGATYFLLAGVVKYRGLAASPGFEYGTTFLITGGLMNALLILDAWDIAHGRERTEMLGNGDGSGSPEGKG